MENLLQHKQLKAFLKSLIEKRWIWIGSTCVFTAAALFFALTKTDKWEATQSLLIRDEVVGSYNPQGRFDSTDSMKAAQEMIVEVARSTEVLKKALIKVGPETSSNKPGWPSLKNIESLKGSVSVGSPHGTEFGTTEVVYLTVKAKSKERAVQLTKAINDELEIALKKIRNERTSSIFDELKHAVDLAKTDLESSTKTLESIETSVGSDLGALRSLNDSGSGDSTLQESLTEIKNLNREAEAARDTLVEQLAFLKSAMDNPEQLVATPNQLLQSQPALQRLKEGLVDAQLRTSELLGRMDAAHPLVKAAQASVQEVRQSLRKELNIAVRGVQADQKVNRTLLTSLANQEAAVHERMRNLAGIRARYSNALAEVEKCNTVYEMAFQELSDARAAQLGAGSASLLTKFNEPVSGNNPLGPGKASILMVGVVGGLFFGIGLVVAITPLEEKFGRRLSDGFRGRRSSDQPGTENRRQTDQRPPGARRATDPTPHQPTGDAGNDRRRERRSDDRRATPRTETPAVMETPPAVEATPVAEAPKPEPPKQQRQNPAPVVPPTIETPAPVEQELINPFQS